MGLIVKQADCEPCEKPLVAGEKPRPARIEKWLEALVGPEGAVEMRALGVTRAGQLGEHAESSFFAPEETKEMASAARGLSGRCRGVYFTLNPVDARLMLSPIGEAARDKDILARRWLLVDCDPVKSDADSSSTDGEKAVSLDVAMKVRDDLRKKAWPDPIVADSGNGYHLLYRIDLPNDDDSKELIKATLGVLSRLRSTDAVKIDTSVSNASRICKLYGTLTKKGESTADRPHRYSCVLEIPSPMQVAGREWLAALVEEHKPPEVNGHANGHTNGHAKKLIAKAKDVIDPVRAYGLAAMGKEIQAVSSAAPGDRNNTLNSASFALGQLVGSGAIHEGDAIAGLTAAGLMAGPNEDKIRATVLRGLRDGKLQPRDLSNVGRITTNPVVVVPGPDGRNESIDDPHRLARVYLDRHCTHRDGLTLRYWTERWYRWYGASWQIVADSEIAAAITSAIKAEFDQHARESGSTSKRVTQGITTNTIAALKSLTLLTFRDFPMIPAWIGGQGHNPVECVAAQNGIVHLPSLMTGADAIYDPTPRFFSPNALDFAFDLQAPMPKAWLAFLDSIWGDDPESIACLQEWFGYFLTPDTRQQKFLLIIGPRRSGKGTIFRVLRSLVGISNVAAPTLSSLATNFGVAPLIGKSVAIIPDARLSARSDAQVVIERILSITGEDAQTIDRKHREDWTGDLLTRFAVASNELPRMGDASGALVGRIVLLKLTRSFYSNEDTTLFHRLVTELPGICLWAMKGWKNLHDRGRFHQPATGQDLLDEFDELSSPVTAFVNERCMVGEPYFVAKKDLFKAWKSWSEDRGRDHPGDEAGFGRMLNAFLPSIGTRRIGTSTRVRTYTGITLKEPDGSF